MEPTLDIGNLVYFAWAAPLCYLLYNQIQQGKDITYLRAWEKTQNGKLGELKEQLKEIDEKLDAVLGRHNG